MLTSLLIDIIIQLAVHDIWHTSKMNSFIHIKCTWDAWYFEFFSIMHFYLAKRHFSVSFSRWFIRRTEWNVLASLMNIHTDVVNYKLQLSDFPKPMQHRIQWEEWHNIKQETCKKDGTQPWLHEQKQLWKSLKTDEVRIYLSGSYSRFRSHASGSLMLVGGDTHTCWPAGIVNPSTFYWLEERYQLAITSRKHSD